MLKRKTLLLFAFIVIVCSFCSVWAEETEVEGTKVASPEELNAALKNTTVTKIVLTNDLKTTSDINISKEVDLSTNSWTISGGNVTLRAMVSNGSITVGKKATILAYTFPSATIKELKGTIRIPKSFTIDCGSGTVASVKYEDVDKTDSGTGVGGARVSDGSVTLMVKTKSNGSSYPVSYIELNDGVKYKAKSGTYVAYYTLSLKSELPNVKNKQSEYTVYQLPITIDALPDEGFLGWTGKTLNGTVQSVTITKENAGNLTFTATYDEETKKKAEEEAKGKGVLPRGGGFNDRGSMNISMTDATGKELEVVELETTELEEDTETTEGEGMPGEGGMPGEPGSSSGSSSRGKRVSVASTKTKTSFTDSAPKTEDVGVTVEADTSKKIKLYAIGGGVVLVALIALIFVRRIGKKR